MEQKKILIADDSELNRAILVEIIGQDYSVIEVSNGKEALAAMQAYQGQIELMLLDIVMPMMDGFEVLAYMREHDLLGDIPVIMISAEVGSTYIEKAFTLGASDYIKRPFVPSAVRRRIMNMIALSEKQHEQDDRFVTKAKNSILLAEILGYAIETHNEEGGMHMSHVDRFARLLLGSLVKKTDEYALDQSDIDALCMASELHDIGKLQIPSQILSKPGKLTQEEFAIVKQHTVLGANLIHEMSMHQDEKLVQYAMEICRWHHERWNGEGYPDGLSGNDIPISAQVVALADVYDALTSKRCYKKTYSHDEALSMIMAGECGSFNPLLIECLRETADALQFAVHTSPVVPEREGSAVHAVTKPSRSGEEMRITLKLEEEQAKRNFFRDVTDEFWYEYTTRPSELRLSSGAMRRTGLPSVLSMPMSNEALHHVLPQESFKALYDRIVGMSEDENYFEINLQMVWEGELRWCQAAAKITWASDHTHRISSMVGYVRDIDQPIRRLIDLGAEEHRASLKLTPIMETGDDILRITHDQVPGVLAGYRQLFDIVRLVDPSICMEVKFDDAERGNVCHRESCYHTWHKQNRCDNCISCEAVRTHKKQEKIENRESELFYVIASCVEVDGVPYSLELVNKLKGSRFIENADNKEEHILTQLLVRNRQVYTDSVTKVYNRRYFDEQLRNLNGEYAIAILDMDNFKGINDTYGHLAGDMVLYRTAQAIKSMIRNDDKVARYGGDEFFLLLKGAPEKTLERKLISIHEKISGIELPEYPGMKISASIGGVYVNGSVGAGIVLADRAVYEAKKNKNGVMIYKER